MSAFADLADAIETVLPEGWAIRRFEPIEDLPDVTSVTLRVRTVSRFPQAPIGGYQVDWVLTVTSPYPSRETADPQLFDDLIDFLFALDGIGAWLGWTEATKTVGDDEQRLAYNITVRTLTKKTEA